MDKKVQDIIFYVLVGVGVLIVAMFFWSQVSDTSGVQSDQSAYSPRVAPGFHRTSPLA